MAQSALVADYPKTVVDVHIAGLGAHVRTH